jgi:hypothetical protein
MATLVRAAAPHDLPEVGALLLRDAAERAASDGALWPTASDARERIARAFGAEGQEQAASRWLVAEAGGAVVGVARFGAIPCPPIYHLAGGVAFVLFDDTYVSPSAGDDTFAALITAAEREGAAMGAVIFLSACAPFQRAKLQALETAGYRVVTQYLVKHRLAGGPAPASVRAATAADVPAIVAMGACSQQALAAANAKMWTPHADAPARFGAWMHYSLTLADRRILVCGDGARGGFVIAQPVSPFHLPLACAREHVGLIDDFWAAAFASDARDLLAAAECAFVQQRRTSAMAIAPAAWGAKQACLRAAGYGEGNAWMLKG